MIAINVSKQEALDNATSIQQINFTANLDRARDTQFFIIEEPKVTISDFSQGTVKRL